MVQLDQIMEIEWLILGREVLKDNNSNSFVNNDSPIDKNNNIHVDGDNISTSNVINSSSKVAQYEDSGYSIGWSNWYYNHHLVLTECRLKCISF